MNALPLTALTLLTAFGLSTMTFAQDQDAPLPPASAQKDVTYATDIKPIFDASCLKCHDSKKPKQGGHICLDTLAGVLKGGKDGPIIVVGDSTKGDLIDSIAHRGDPMSYMPKKAKKLSDAQIGLIRAWIDQGAK